MQEKMGRGSRRPAATRRACRHQRQHSRHQLRLACRSGSDHSLIPRQGLLACHR